MRRNTKLERIEGAEIENLNEEFVVVVVVVVRSVRRNVDLLAIEVAISLLLSFSLGS